MGRLQVGIGAIEGVAGAVIRERQQLVLRRHRPLEVPPDAGRIGRGVVGVLVDVVAEVDDRIHTRKLGDGVVDVEQATLEMGAAEHRQHHVLGRPERQGARLPHGRSVLVEMEAVPVAAAGLEAADVHLDGMVAVGPDGRAAAAHYTLQLRIRGDGPANGSDAGPRRGDPCPDDQAVGRRITRGDTVKEGWQAGRRIGLDWRRGRRQQAEPQKSQDLAPIHRQLPPP